MKLTEGIYRPIVTWLMILLAASIMTFLAALFSGASQAHYWYDELCCAANDCAEVIEQKDHPDGWLMTTKHGTTLVPINMPKGEEWREKENKYDGKTHVCMRRHYGGGDMHDSSEPAPPGGMVFLCIYRPALN